MRKEEYSLAAVGFLLLSLAFPPYFVAFLSASALGGLAYLLKSLNEEEREELTEFEREFRQGYLLEQDHRYMEAEKVYIKLCEKYPKFAYIAQERIKFIEKEIEEQKREIESLKNKANYKIVK